MENLFDMKPEDVRKLIRNEKITGPTAGMCNGFAQANLVILPEKYAKDFEIYANSNSKACPVLEITEKGDKFIKVLAKNSNITTDIPKYRIYRNGILTEEVLNIEKYWQEGFIAFLIGCSFTFEYSLIEAGIEIRHITMGRNVPMYKTNILTAASKFFKGPMVVSMRPIKKDKVDEAVRITSQYPEVHGAPIHAGNPEAIGIKDISKPNYGDSVEIKEDEVPVFWACGVTPQAACENAKPDIMITHAPGHMFITDIKNEALKSLDWRNK